MPDPIRTMRVLGELQRVAQRMEAARKERDRLVVRAVVQGVPQRAVAEAAGFDSHSAVGKVVARAERERPVKRAPVSMVEPEAEPGDGSWIEDDE